MTAETGPGLVEAVLTSWRLLFDNLRFYLRFALLPFAMFMALHRLEEIVKPEAGMAILGWTFLFTVLAAIPATMLLMPWFRMLLAARSPALAARPAGWWWVVLGLRWAGLDVLMFLALAPVLGMAIRVVSAGGAQVPHPELVALYWATMILGGYLIYGRMGLSLAGAAAEADHRYRISWAATRHNGWRIGLAIILCWLSVDLPVDFLRSALAEAEPSPAVDILDAAFAALFRTVNELLSAAVYVQFFLAGKSVDESVFD